MYISIVLKHQEQHFRLSWMQMNALYLVYANDNTVTVLCRGYFMLLNWKSNIQELTKGIEKLKGN